MVAGPASRPPGNAAQPALSGAAIHAAAAWQLVAA
jgi:hypothetical protein